MSERGYIKDPKPVILRSNLKVILNIYDLEKVGAGHDGYVYRLGNLCLKLLKHGLDGRKEKGLITFDKAIYFQDNLDLKRIITPCDVLLDSDGVYTGYVMRYITDVTKDSNSPYHCESGDFTCRDLVSASTDLQMDFEELTKKKVLVKDINRGSYIYSYDFLHLCDTDKYIYGINNTYEGNIQALNFVIAKFLYNEMLKRGNIQKNELKLLSEWVKKCCNTHVFVPTLIKEVEHEDKMPIKEYADYKLKRILK